MSKTTKILEKKNWVCLMFFSVSLLSVVLALIGKVADIPILLTIGCVMPIPLVAFAFIYTFKYVQ